MTTSQLELRKKALKLAVEANKTNLSLSGL